MLRRRIGTSLDAGMDREILLLKRFEIFDAGAGVEDDDGSYCVGLANNRQALMSSGWRPLYSSNISAVVAPWARTFSMNSTVRRVPLMTGFPVMTFGLSVIRSSSI